MFVPAADFYALHLASLECIRRLKCIRFRQAIDTHFNGNLTILKQRRLTSLRSFFYGGDAS